MITRSCWPRIAAAGVVALLTSLPFAAEAIEFRWGETRILGVNLCDGDYDAGNFDSGFCWSGSLAVPRTDDVAIWPYDANFDTNRVSFLQFTANKQARVLNSIVDWNLRNLLYFLTDKSGTALQVSGALGIRDGQVIASKTVVEAPNSQSLRARLELNYKGTLTSDTVLVGSLASNTGRLNMNAGSRLDVAGSIHLGGTGLVNGGSGWVNAYGGSQLFANGLKVWNASSGVTMGGGVAQIAGTMHVADGGRVDSYSPHDGVVDSLNPVLSSSQLSVRAADITGQGSYWGEIQTLVVGNAGSGTLTILDGGTVSAGTTRVGALAGSNGRIDVGGIAGKSVFTNGGAGLYVGGSATASGGTGIVNVTPGGTVNVTRELKLWNANSSVNLASTAAGVVGGMVNVGGQLIVTGGTVTSVYGWVDNGTVDPLGNGLVARGAELAGTSARWQNANLNVGFYGAGTMNVTNGAIVVSTDFGSIGAFTGQGTVKVEGNNASWNIASVLDIGDIRGSKVGRGTLVVNTGGRVSAGSAIVRGNSWIDTTGGGVVTIAGALALREGADLRSFWAAVDSQGAIFASNLLTAQSATITDGGSNWTANTLIVGRTGSGSLNITGGGQVDAAHVIVGEMASSVGNIGLATSASYLKSSGDEWIGNSGTGSFVQSAGTHAVTGYLLIGRNGGSTGNIALSGGSLQAGYEYVGHTGKGTLDQTGGTHVVKNYLVVGHQSGSNGTQSLSAGSLQAGYAFIGDSGQGAFDQSGGSHVVDNYLVLGANASGRGKYELSDGSLTSGDVYVGAAGAAAFIQTGGTHTVTRNLILGANAGSSGTYTLDGGLLTANRIQTGAGSGTFQFNGGVLAVGNFEGNVVNSNGTVAPGSSPGSTIIAGNYQQGAAGTYAVEIGGLLAGSEYDVLSVSGTATLDGTLRVAFWKGYTASAGDSFDILRAATLIGGFGTTDLAALGTGLVWQLDYLLDPASTDTLRLSVLAVPEPKTWATLLAGLLMLGGVLRRRAALPPRHDS